MANSYFYKNIREEWLRQHGDRNESDIFKDVYGEYVWMQAGQFEVKVYLPRKIQNYYTVIHRSGMISGDMINI